MTNSKSTKRALVSSALALFLCVTMLMGTTFAWFTDTASTSVNKIQAGTLDVDIIGATDDNSITGTGLKFVDAENSNDILWEPGATFKTEGFRIANNGNLALKYTLALNGVKGNAKLLEVIDFSVVNGDGTAVALDKFVGKIAANAEPSDVLYIQGSMKKEAGNAYQGLSIKGISITVYATQDTVEYDSKDNQYDGAAEYFNAAKVIKEGTHEINETITIDGGKDTVDAIRVTGGNVTIKGGSYSATGTGANSALRVDGGNVTIEGGNFYVGGDNNCIYGAGGNITIKGGTFRSEKEYAGHYWVLNVKDYSGSTITLMGGKFYGFDPTDAENNTAPEGETEIVLADGYKVVQNGDYYEVVAE